MAPNIPGKAAVLAVSLMLAAFPLLAQGQGKERPMGPRMERSTAYRTTQIDGL